MPVDFTLPPDTRVAGQGNPPQDMDNVIDALTASGAGMNVLNAAFAGGADPAGSADSTAAIQAAINAVPASGGYVRLPVGTYKVTSTLTVTQPSVYLIGDGVWATTIKFTGTGDCIRMYSAAQYVPHSANQAGGGILGMMIDGNSAGAGSAGFHIGDIYNLRFDCGIRYFGGAGSKGAWFDNNYHWTEQLSGRIWCENNAANVVFDNSANTSGAATGSFDRMNLDVYVNANGLGDGVRFQNGAQLIDGRLGIYGNFTGGATQTAVLTLTGPSSFSFTATNASPCVFTAAGSYYYNGAVVVLTGGSLPGGFTAGTTYFVVNASGATFQLAATSGGTAINSSSSGSGTVAVASFLYSGISGSVLNIGCELDATAGTLPYTINFGTAASNAILATTGVIDFGTAFAFAGANNAQGSFEFDGPVYGDGFLQSSGPLGLRPFKFSGSGGSGNLGNGDSITTRFSAIVEVTTSGNVTGIILQGFNPDNWRQLTLMNNGTGTITFAAQASSHVAGGAASIVAANSNAVFTWNSDLSLWFMAGGAVSETLITPELALAPSGATGETFHDRGLGQAYLSGLTSGTVYVSAVYLPGGLAVNNITLMVGGIAFTTVTHGWYALLDSGRVVRAVSADQSGGNWGSTFAAVTLSVSAAGYVTTAPGLYYVAFCAVFSGSGEFPALVPNLGGLGGLSPVLCATSSTGQTTPPSTGTTMGALTHLAAGRFYAYTS